jgi:hypothetical protein
MDVKIGFQQCNSGRCQLLRIFPDLPVEGGMIMPMRSAAIRSPAADLL